MINKAIWIFILLLIGHAVADGPLQRALELNRRKNRRLSSSTMQWQMAMAIHAGTHAIAVMLITRSLILGVAEFVAHWWIDDAKCRGRLNTVQDQLIHVACKIVWAAIAIV